MAAPGAAGRMMGEAAGPPLLRAALLISAPGWRGSGASFAKVARGLEQRGHASLVITVSPRLTARFREEGLDVTELPLENTGFREARALYKRLQRFDADVIMVDTPRDQRLAVLAALPLGIPVVYRYNLNTRPPRNHLADRLFLGRTAALAFQSEFIRSDTLTKVPWLARLPAFRIPNGYDTDRYAPDPAAGAAFRASRGIAPTARVVLTGSKLGRNKGHDTSFAAVALLHRMGRPVRYIVCGDGPRGGELRALAERLGIDVVLTGLVHPADMVGAYNAADVVVHPSSSEIFPNAVAEAMACGRAVVGVNGGGLPEVLGSSGVTGLLVPPDAPEPMADAVAGLLDDPGRAAGLGRAGRDRIRTEFTLDRMIDGYEAMFRQVCAGAGTATNGA